MILPLSSLARWLWLDLLLLQLLLPHGQAEFSNGLFDPEHPPTLEELPPFAFRTHVPLMELSFDVRISPLDKEETSLDSLHLIRAVLTETLTHIEAAHTPFQMNEEEGRLLRIGGMSSYESQENVYRVDASIGGFSATVEQHRLLCDQAWQQLVRRDLEMAIAQDYDTSGQQPPKFQWKLSVERSRDVALAHTHTFRVYFSSRLPVTKPPTPGASPVAIQRVVPSNPTEQLLKISDTAAHTTVDGHELEGLVVDSLQEAVNDALHKETGGLWHCGSISTRIHHYGQAFCEIILGYYPTGNRGAAVIPAQTMRMARAALEQHAAQVLSKLCVVQFYDEDGDG